MAAMHLSIERPNRASTTGTVPGALQIVVQGLPDYTEGVPEQERMP